MGSLTLAALIAALVLSTAQALPQGATAQSPAPNFPPAGMQFEKPFPDYLIPAVRQTGRPARIYYAACPFPRLNFDLPAEGLRGLDSIHQMLPHEPQVNIAQGRDGMVRITIGNVPTAILHVQIRRLVLKPYAQYGAAAAILAVLSSPEVREAGKLLT